MGSIQVFYFIIDIIIIAVTIIGYNDYYKIKKQQKKNK
jgi:hypothetical protein